MPVLNVQVPVFFGAGEFAVGGTPYSSIGLADGLVKIGDITIRGGYETRPNGPSGETVKVITGASLEFGDPALFTLTAGSVTYKKFNNGDLQVIVESGEIRFGETLSLFGNFNIKRGGSASVTTVAFANMGFRVDRDGKTLVTVAGNGSFQYGGPSGFEMQSFAVTDFGILPTQESTGATVGTATSTPMKSGTATSSAGASSGFDSNGELVPAPVATPKTYTLGPVTFTDPSVTVGNFKVTYDKEVKKVKINITLTLGVASASLKLPGGSSATIKDGDDADKYGIAGAFTVAVYLDPAKMFKPEWGGLDGFDLAIDQFSLGLGKFLTISAEKVKYSMDPAPGTQMLYFGTASASITVGGFTIGGSAKDFGFNADGSFYTGKTFGVTLSIGQADGASKLKLPSWLPLKNLAVGLEWRNFNTDPTDLLITLDAEVSSIQGLPNLQFSGGVKGMKIDLGLLNAGQFPIVSLESFNVSVSGNAFGGQVKGAFIAGILKLSDQSKIIASTDSTTAVAKRVFYGGIQGGLTLPGMGSMEIRIGFCEFGPLGLFISSGIPIILDPNSGIAITDLRGGIEFGATMPDPMIYEKDSAGNPVLQSGVPKIDASASAMNLRNYKQASNPSTMTAAQWENDLRSQVATIVKNSGGQR